MGAFMAQLRARKKSRLQRYYSATFRRIEKASAINDL